MSDIFNSVYVLNPSPSPDPNPNPNQVEAFVNARRMVKTEPETMVSMCHELLEQPDVEAAIRVGDVYALMIEWFYSQRQMEQAHTLVEKMRGRGIILSPYLDAEMVQAIYGAMGEAVPHDPAAPPTFAVLGRELSYVSTTRGACPLTERSSLASASTRSSMPLMRSAYALIAVAAFT